jgi:hypothetical protein
MVVLSWLMFAADVSAQSGFVQGGFQREIKRFSGEPGETVFDGTVNGVSFGGGGFLSPHWTAGIEIDLGAESSAARSTTVTILGRPATITTTYTSQRRSASALVGYHASRKRVTLGCYAGLSFSAVRREIASDAPDIVLGQPSPVSIFTNRTAGPIVGFDVAIEVAPHVAVVPGFRAQALTLSGDLAGHSIRPGVNVRIVF